MKALKSFVLVFSVFALVLASIMPVFAENLPMQKRKLMVTAYYSPLPNQKFYIRGSYEADVRLNGRGTNGADGTPVYEGMLAAPKTYSFGTRIKIPGLGVGEVHDRGGAILARKDYDRIDVWMGYGEEGLSRALNWGARIVDGEVYFTPHQIEAGLNFNWVESELPPVFVKKLIKKTLPPESIPKKDLDLKNPQKEEKVAEKDVLENKELKRLEENRMLLSAGIGKDDSGESVKNLQRMLWELGYYKSEINGVYDEKTIDAVFQLQIDNEVIHGEFERGAGYFGKRTLNALLLAIKNKIHVLSQYPKEVQAWLPEKRVLPEIASLNVPKFEVERQTLNFANDVMNKKVVQDFDLNTELSLNDRGEEVIKLQNFLIAHSYLVDSLNTGYFGEKTREAVLKFQIDQGIVTGTDDLGAGCVGPRTLNAIHLF